ncbi:winged helix-turn-helix transcriptional regulator [Streptomyces sp. ISL-98]|uniref:DUF5937 family protein n=1 Tax=Streptomyces sp. ISL-98 TaxID=2819192 RepID=UPI001BEBE674|nr:DUF5937 family protein [Streptomyces sp. ISL-98]MBT2506917.1 winged helix-turn-helix transcriptional regulator [Streptomyces sp. ISL-98]
MSVTIDITGLRREQILFAPSPLSELAEMLHVMSAPAHHPGLHGWAVATASSLPSGLADRIDEASFLWHATRADILLPAQPQTTLTGELDALDRLDDELFVAAALEISCMAQYYRGVPEPLTSERDRRQALERATARGPREAAFAERLLRDPHSTRNWLRRLLEDCEQKFFAEVWQNTQTGLYSDTRHKAELLKHKGIGPALTSMSSAFELDEANSRLVADKLADTAGATKDLGLTCIPTAFGWPHLVVKLAPGWRPVIQYPISGPNLPQPMAVKLVQLRLEALAHPVRMRLCRALARGPHTVGELAGAYGLTSPEVSRHLSRLKKASLLTTQRRGRYVLHHLDLTAVARLGNDFLDTLLR